jgi:hypothetical protein
MVDAVKGKFVHAPRGNRLAIFLGVTAALVVAGLPLMNKRVYATEQKMAEMRDNQYDAMDFKNEARNARLSIKRQQ